MCDFNISILNLNGARTDFKRATLFKCVDIKHIDIVETHSCPKKESDWRRAFNGELILSHRSSLSRVVGILFARRCLPVFFTIDEVISSVLLKVKAVSENVKLALLNVYAPTNPVERIAFSSILSNCRVTEFIISQAGPLLLFLTPFKSFQDVIYQSCGFC